MNNNNDNKQIAPAQAFGMALTEKYQERIVAHLGASGIPFENFKQVLVTAYENNPDLQGKPQSLMNAVVKCARDGLLPDGKEAALVPFGGKITYMPMVDGVIKKIHETGLVKSVMVEIVRENDSFARWSDETGPHYKWVPAEKEKGNFEGVFALVIMKDGGHYFHYMDKDEVKEHENCSKNKQMWTKWKSKMWKKTAIHQVAKLLPKGSFKGDFESTLNDEPETFQQSENIGERAEEQERAVSENNDTIEGDFEDIDIPEGTF